MSLAPFVQIVARGQSRTRPMSLDEAQQAMRIILRGNAAPEAIGALLMVMRYRGETPAEIAGFTAALRQHIPAQTSTFDLDWPCYAAGRTRGAPLFLLAAKLVAQTGFRVALHGWNSHQSTAAPVRDALASLNIPTNTTNAPIAYFPLEDLSPEALTLLKLRDTFGLRSCLNTVLRMWHPCGAPATVQGVFHPSYRSLQAEAAQLLGQQSLTIIKGGGGEFERNPAKPVAIFGLRNGEHIETSAPEIINATRKMHDPDNNVAPAALWQGEIQDAFAEQTVIGTAALALWTLGAAASVPQAEILAYDLWNSRERRLK